MAPSQATIEQTLAHPIDLVSRFVARQDWMLCQQEPDALIAEIPGRWSQYQLAVSWQDTEETMQVVCRIDLKAGQSKVGELAMLAALLNQQLYDVKIPFCCGKVQRRSLVVVALVDIYAALHELEYPIKIA